MSPAAYYSIGKLDPTHEDAEDLISELHAQCWNGSEWFDPGTAHWWIARHSINDEPVGFGGLRTSTLEGGGFLVRGGVIPEHRGMGLQRRLIKAREGFARKLGLKFLVTNTILGNVWSANNLIEEGFRMYSPLVPYGDDDDSYWRKELK